MGPKKRLKICFEVARNLQLKLAEDEPQNSLEMAGNLDLKRHKFVQKQSRNCYDGGRKFWHQIE